MLRLASRKPKKEQPVHTTPTSVQEFLTWTATHISVVKDLVAIQYKQYLQVGVRDR